MKRNPTQQDIAEAAGVSRGLVSLALSGAPHVAEETRERILRTARELGYTRNLGAASLAANRSQLIGVILPNLRNPFFEGVVDAIQKRAEERGFMALFAATSNDPAREESIMQRFRELRASGIVAVSTVRDRQNLREMAELVPLVLVGAPPMGGSIDAIHVDERAAADLVVSHALERDWRKIVHISDDAGAGRVWVERRRDALIDAAREAGLPFTLIDAGEDLMQIARMEKDLWKVGRVAIVAHNDLLGSDAIAAVRAAGMDPGVDVGVIGYDDTYLSRRPEYDMTSVRQDPDAFAIRTLEALDSRGGDLSMPGREWRLEPTLSVRSST